MRLTHVNYPLQIVDVSLVDADKSPNPVDPDAVLEAIKAEQLPEVEAAIAANAAALVADAPQPQPEELAEASKAGAELNKKNKGILSSILHAHTGIGHALGALLGQEADEPEHAVIRDELVSASRQLMGSGPMMQAQKAEDAAPVDTGTEEDDMPTLEEFGALLNTQLAPVLERLTAVEEVAKAAAIPVATPAPAASVVPELTEAQKAAGLTAERLALEEAIRIYEARKAAGSFVPSAEDAFKGAYRLVTEDGWERVHEASKAAVPVEQRPTMRQALRMLNGRNLRTGYFPVEA